MERLNLAVVAAARDAIEASQMRAELENHGIKSFVDGDNSSTALSHVGSAIGGVKVLVSSIDTDRAKLVIAEMHCEDQDDSAGEWFCGVCNEIVDGTFQICWSCGKERAEVEAPMPPHAIATPDTESPAKNRTPSEAERSNPYTSPQSPSVENQTAEPENQGLVSRLLKFLGR